MKKKETKKKTSPIPTKSLQYFSIKGVTLSSSCKKKKKRKTNKALEN